MISMSREWRQEPARRWVAYGLLLYGAAAVGRAVCQAAEGCTLGGFVKILLPSLAVLCVAFVVAVVDIRQFLSGLDLRDRGTLGDVALGAALASACLPLILVGQIVGLTYSLAGLIVVTGFTIACVLTVRRPGPEGLVALLLVLPFLAFLEWDFRAAWFAGGLVGPFLISPTVIAVWMFFLFSLAPVIVGRGSISLAGIGPYVGAWIFLVLLSSLAAVDPLMSLQEASLEIFCFPLFFVIVASRVRSAREAVMVTWGIVCYGILRIGIVYYFYLQVQQFDMSQAAILNSVQIYRVIDHVGLIGCMGIFVMPLAISLVAIAKVRRSLVLASLGAVFCGAAIVSSQVRSTVLPMLTTLPFIALHRTRRLPILCCTSGLIVAVLIIGFTVQPNLFSRFQGWQSWSTVVAGQVPRIDAWKVALKILRDYPLTGIGEGMWDRYYTLYTERIFWWGKMRLYVNSAHHILLHQAATGGVPLLIAWIGLIAVVLKKSVRTLRTAVDRRARSLTVGYLWSFVGFLTVGMIGGAASLHMRTWDLRRVIDGGMMFWLIVGMICSLHLIVESGDRQS
ncbi:hypothetical protein AMJ39_00935 [candidate division TA06 bacterium DG_24]|uniref:O-antigen ligase-related domain-containing protein n=3 Tax=Bacteria division TA06 TaxID=1156500 RepID=A0A0S8JRU6_UNCT6|nr:MAG: hypothetical protein AMJ39_00935 [candidate division TA06 bacterium DG_24]KPK71672.1 MAG: hypothetical protein AMJ82_00230 [candidate division TA06 bacterium SM23_40]KPL11564.1 MAG: hypothetical protein AMJ71_00295 [candidate division TA06 bacterium SM1_40]